MPFLFSLQSANNHKRCVETAFFALLIVIFGLAIPTSAETEYNIVNNANINTLSQTGLPADKVQSIKDQIAGVSVKPEVTVPVEGGTVSGQNILLKGVASPNTNVDIVIGVTNGTSSPLMGKTTSDKYGVWTYSLGPDLQTGAYTLQVTVTDNNNQTQTANPVNFTVIGTGAGTENSVMNNLWANSFGGNNLTFIIIAVIVSITFLLAIVILALVPYTRLRREYAERFQSWSVPELAGLDENDWHNFVKQTETLRHLKAAVGQKAEDSESNQETRTKNK